MPQIQDVFDRTTEYSLIDPEMLLPRHRHLLDINFEVLESGPTSHRLVWLADMICIVSLHTVSTGVPNTTGSHTFLCQRPLSPTQSETDIGHRYIVNTGMKTRTLGSVLKTGMVGCSISYVRRQDICNSANMLLRCGCSRHPADKKDKSYVCPLCSFFDNWFILSFF
jgi:hypothetical protein